MSFPFPLPLETDVGLVASSSRNLLILQIYNFQLHDSLKSDNLHLRLKKNLELYLMREGEMRVQSEIRMFAAVRLKVTRSQLFLVYFISQHA